MRTDTARFVQHEPCPKCHSRDNLGRWDDGHGHCFGCGYYEPGTGGSFLNRSLKETTNEDGTIPKEQCSVVIRDDAYRWLKRYGITEEEIRTHGIVWLPNRESLAFGFDRESGNYYTRRYFGSNPDYPKYVHSRAKDFIILDGPLGTPVAPHNNQVLQGNSQNAQQASLIFVEDFLSAIKVSRICSASPIFGSNVGLDRLKRASKLFKRLGIWLDSDMYPKAVLEAIKAKSVGLPCYGAIKGPRDDPKDHTDGEIYDAVRELFKEKAV